MSVASCPSVDVARIRTKPLGEQNINNSWSNLALFWQFSGLRREIFSWQFQHLKSDEKLCDTLDKAFNGHTIITFNWVIKNAETPMISTGHFVIVATRRFDQGINRIFVIFQTSKIEIWSLLLGKCNCDNATLLRCWKKNYERRLSNSKAVPVTFSNTLCIP